MNLAAILAFARRPWVKRSLQVVVVALIVFFVGRALVTGWSSVTQHSWQINWALMLLGFALLAGQEISFGFIWQLILRRMGFLLPWRICLRLYLAAEFVRYIPGNVWHVLTRVTWAEKRGVPKSFGLASMIVELATKIASAALIFAISLLWWSGLDSLGDSFGRYASITIAIIGVPLLLFGMQPRILSWALNRGLKILKRPPITLDLSYRDILDVTLSWLGSWLIGGLGFWLVVQAVNPTALSFSGALICVGIYALGWDIGFLSFVTPSGLFFREGAVALLLSLSGIVSDHVVAGIIAVLASRLVPTIAELLCVGWAFAATRATGEDQVAPRVSAT